MSAMQRAQTAPYHMLLFIVILLSATQLTESCTTLICGSKATTDGSVLASHSSDGGGTLDPRLVRIPARDFPPNSSRPVFASPENYPRYSGTYREAPEYFPENCQSTTEKCAALTPIGFIPQVPHTFSYFESTYGIMNEHQVGLAESTCSGVFSTTAVNNGGSALFSIDQLSHLAMERATTAREAVSLMGSIAETYGFYGESDSFEGGAESLLVTDPSEGFIFHILPDPTGTSAIWAAQRVPDDDCSVIANMFIIREINLTDSQNFLGTTNMWEIAAKEGLWSEGDPHDFTGTFSDGEYSHKYYTGRRVWGAYRLLSPQTALPALYDDLKADRPYPVSAPVNTLLTPSDLFAVHRDWYQGTIYDPGEAGVLAGGAFGSPDRYGGGEGESEVVGAWERTIALYRTSSSFVVQSRKWLPSEIGGVIWFGAYAPHGSCFVPIMPGSMTESPMPLAHVYQGVMDKSTNFWAYRMVMNLAQIKFNYIIVDIRESQLSLESESQKLIDNISEKYNHADFSSLATKQEITSLLTRNVGNVRDSFLELFDTLMFKYADGWINSWDADGFSSINTGYPAWWLEAVNYAAGPGPLVSPTPSSAGKDDTIQGGSPASRNSITGKMSMEHCLRACLETHSRQGDEADDEHLTQCSTCCIHKSMPC
mmetsp:Transcript_25962/g.43787  ORF Transcript_25962/g.43787 Transcript_25962/m.43787 type:complete len:653 (-) Transcript_25962:36-1994(-)